MKLDEIAIWVNILLVVVTAAYAIVTYKLAKSSREASTASQKAAEAAAESARHQAAAIEADTNRRYAWFKTGGGGGADPDFWEFVVIPLIGAYVLHEVVLRRFSFTVNQESRTFEPNLHLLPRGQSLSLEVDEVEGAMFEMNFSEITGGAYETQGWAVTEWELVVTYSHSLSSQGRRRVLVTNHPENDPRFEWIRKARERGIW